ncbi:unnamed protein product, partial [Symbiodinium microadriaticum]
ALKEKIAKGQMPHCLFKDLAAVDQQPLNRQEMWAAMQYKPIYRTAGKWTYWDLLPDDIRQPPPQFCNEIETPQKDSWADATEQEAASETASSSKPQPAQEPKAASAATGQPLPADRPGSSKDDIQADDAASSPPGDFVRERSDVTCSLATYRAGSLQRLASSLAYRAPASAAYLGTAYHHKGEKDVGLPTPTYPAVTSATDTSVVGDIAERGVPLSVARALLKKSLEKFTAGTLERYIAAAKHFLDFFGLSNRTIASIDVAFLADFLHACENSLEEDREVCKIGPRPILKALSWLGRHAECQPSSLSC